jgi:hypothetical protein
MIGFGGWWTRVDEIWSLLEDIDYRVVNGVDAAVVRRVVQGLSDPQQAFEFTNAMMTSSA